jgi:hypothetical protein
MKMNKKIITAAAAVIAVLVLFLPGSAQFADWKTELTELLAKKKDYWGAAVYLESHMKEVSAADKPFAWLTMAFCGNGFGDKALENRWITAFFETYKGNTDVFPLPDMVLNREIGDYLRAWRRKYPVILRTGLIRDRAFENSSLPDRVTVGVEMSVSVNYRLMHKDQMLRGGVLAQGLNFIRIPAAGLFDKSGVHRYSLDMKSGDLTIQKEIVLDITCQRPDDSGQATDKMRETGYGVAMFIENRLIAFHKKTVKRHRLSRAQMDRNLRLGDRLVGRPPDPLDIEGKQFERASIPILAIPVMAYKYLKPKLKKKKKKVVKTFDSLSVTYLIEVNGVEKPLDASITLRLE